LVGLGEMKLVDTGHTRDSRAKNRRVEVTVFSADPNAAPMSSSPSAQKQQ
jgi:hypothetical protein